ncbi:DUF1097 domain-containing protein [Dysgonomonas sp. ZJ709]|uniref:DUF1097 domain-containing protein n=1 Tax=Dysgonomonas sp. ZJ709 TaxID=2709797 RepID=UPI0013ED29DC|nr:DUF1097 domain-containing protein [Dysgonomonas sp. ZJ709]
MGLITVIAAFIALQFDLYIWMIFIALCSYYLFGSTPKAALLTFTQQIIAITLAIVCHFSAIGLSNYMDGMPALLISIFVLTAGLFFVTKFKILNKLTIYFTGLIIWFASGYEFSIEASIKIITALTLGYMCGWLNMIVDGWIDKRTKTS